MSFSRSGFRRRNKKEDQDNPGLRFLYSEAVAKVLWKYSSCVNTVSKKYPASYPYKDNSELTIQNLPHLAEHYEELAEVSENAKDRAPSAVDPARRRTTAGRVKRAATFILPQIDPQSGVNSRGATSMTREATTASDYHKHCRDRRSESGDYAFLTERRSAYHSRRIPSILGTPPPYTFSNRLILEKIWIERIPLYSD